MSPLRFWTYILTGLAIAVFFVWLGDLLFQNEKWIPKIIGVLLWIVGYLGGGGICYTALSRLAWRTRILSFLRSFFPPQ